MSSRILRAVLLVLFAACGDSGRQSQRTEKAEPRVPESLHIVTIGDSLAYGAGDESGKGIAGRIGNELRSHGVVRVETTNLGVNGAQTADLLSRLDQPRVQKSLAGADAIVLSIGANDLFRTPGAREETMRAPLAVAERILGRVEQIVLKVRQINPEAYVLVLGGYNPVPSHPLSPLIAQYLTMWDETLAARFEEDRKVSVVRMSDLVGPSRLSRYDNFHPGGEAYAAVSRRIAGMLLDDRAA